MVAVRAARYQIVRLLGEGGMGRVFEAVHSPSGRRVAIKTIARAASDPNLRRMLLDEATAAAQVVHPNIVRLLEVGRDPSGSVFLAMELVAGHDLEPWTSAWPGWKAFLRAMRGILAGLVEVHASGIVHGDLKPSNVLLDEGGVAKLTDFGIAQLVDPLTGSTQSRRGVAGTPLYMAPEQMEGAGAVGPWSDLYAMGVLMHEMLGARSPFEARTIISLHAEKLRGAPPLKAQHGLWVPDELRDLVSRLLHPHPRKRLRFAAEAALALDAAVAAIGDLDDAPVVSASLASAPTFGLATNVDLRTMSLDGAQPSSRQEAPEEAPPSSLPSELSAGPGLAMGLLRMPPVVGRAPELGRLLHQVSEVREKGGVRAVVVIGAAGVGKSRLARTVLAEVERRGAMEGVAAGYDISGTTVSGGLKQALRRALAVPAQKQPSPVDLEWLDDPVAARAAEWLSEEQPTSARSADDIAYATVRALSKRRPLYLWLDDVGWSHDGTLALVEQLVTRQDANALVVMTMRRGTADHPDIRAWLDRLSGDAHVSVEQLGTLGREDRRALALAIAPLSPAVADALATRNETPLVLVQAVRDWIERGLLVLGPNGYETPGGADSAQLLAERTDLAIIGARLDAMLGSFGQGSTLAESVFFTMALLGVRFAYEDARRSVAVQELSALDAVLDRAIVQGLLQLDGERTYRFEHGLIQEVVLERLALRPDHGVWERRVADALAVAYGDTKSELQTRIADLLRSAGDLDRSTERLVMAARLRIREGSYEAADRVLDRMTRELEDDSVPEVHVRRAMTVRVRGNMAYHRLAYDAAVVDFKQAEALATELGLAEQVLEIQNDLAAVYFYQDRLYECERITRDLILASGSAPPFRALQRLSDLVALRGDFEGALAISRQAGDMRLLPIDGFVPVWQSTWVAIVSAELSAALGRLDEADRYEQRARSYASNLEINFSKGELDDVKTRLMIAHGKGSSMRTRTAVRIEHLAEQGDRWRMTSLRLLAALIESEDGPVRDLVTATEAFLAAYAAVKHDEPYTWWGMAELARRLRKRGQSALGDRVGEALALRREQLARAFMAPEPAP